MLEIISALILIISLVGMIVIIKRTMPFLVELSFEEDKPGLWGKFKNKNFFSKNLFLQKVLSKIRILVLKTDNKTSEWIKRLREKSKENKTKFSDSYWDKLRK